MMKSSHIELEREVITNLMLRIVLDTNVLVSAVIAKGSPETFLDWPYKGDICLLNLKKPLKNLCKFYNDPSSG